jgi:hypothetical protein
MRTSLCVGVSENLPVFKKVFVIALMVLLCRTDVSLVLMVV